MKRWVRTYIIFLSTVILIFIMALLVRAHTGNERGTVCIINNTYHTYSIFLKNDSVRILGPDSRISFNIFSLAGGREGLQQFIDQNIAKIMDENNVDWAPRLRNAVVWNRVELPDGGGKVVWFVLMNRNDDKMERLQNLGMIKLFRIGEGLLYLAVLTSVVGLFYVKLRFRWILILMLLLMNFPVIFYTADFGSFIRPVIDPLFIVPRWVAESTRYYVRFSIPVGAFLVWGYLLYKRMTLENFRSADSFSDKKKNV